MNITMTPYYAPSNFQTKILAENHDRLKKGLYFPHHVQFDNNNVTIGLKKYFGEIAKSNTT